MAGGPLPKRVICPKCSAPEGMSCRGPDFKNCKPHPERIVEAEQWYTRVSPDGLTPQRRDAMVAALQLKYGTGKGKIGPLMQQITTSANPEVTFAQLNG